MRPPLILSHPVRSSQLTSDSSLPDDSPDQPLDLEIVQRLFAELTEEIAGETGVAKTSQEVALGFLEVANEGASACRPVAPLRRL